MKSKYVFLSIFMAALLFFVYSCDPEVVPPPDKKLAVLTTTVITNIGQDAATTGGNITSDEGSAVTARGVCWATTQNPDLTTNFTTNGTGIGEFVSELTQLEPSTTYYVRAYATTANGIAYGNEVSFTTDVLFLASMTPSNRVAVLEDFTGVRCGYCPDGHAVAKSIKTQYPDQFIVMAVHAGGYATPTAGWANFTTPYGNTLVAQAKVAGFPAGTLNRLKADVLGVTPQVANGYAVSRNYWPAAAAAVMQMPAPVNIGAKATFNPTNRELSIRVDLYYTEDGGGNNYINVALLQDKLFSKQSGGTPDANNYEQNHVLRDLITGQWGEKSTVTTKGSKVTKTYTYTVPTDYNGLGTEGGGAVVIDNLKVVVLVCTAGTNVLNATEVDVE